MSTTTSEFIFSQNNGTGLYQNVKNLLCIDIETVPMVHSFDALSPDFQRFWKEKCAAETTDEKEIAELFNQRGGLGADFGKIICIGMATLRKKENKWHIRTKVLCDPQEEKNLQDFADLFKKNKDRILVGHNIKNFDIPFLYRRYLKHKITPPPIIDIQRKTSWNLDKTIFDTLTLWKLGSYSQEKASLDFLCHHFNIPSPKTTDMDGSQVRDTYYATQPYSKDGLQKIAAYCRKDVVAELRVLLHMGNFAHTIPDEHIEHIE